MLTAAPSTADQPASRGIRAAAEIPLASGAALGVALIQAPGTEQTSADEDCLPAQAIPLALASADFDHDGSPDLVAAVLKSDGTGLIVVFPANRALRNPDQLRAPSEPAFLGCSTAVPVPGPPHLVAADDFDGDGAADVVVASRGGAEVWLLPGLPNGELGKPVPFRMPGLVTALATGELDAPDGLPEVLVGVSLGSEAGVHVLQSRHGTLADGERIRTASPATTIVFGDLDGNPAGDVAIATERSVTVVYGRQALDHSGRRRSRAWNTGGEILGLTTLPARNGADHQELAFLTHDGRIQALDTTSHRGASTVTRLSGAIRSPLARGPGRYDLLPTQLGGQGQGLLFVDRDAGRLLAVTALSDAAPRSTEIKLEGSRSLAVLPLRLNGDAFPDWVTFGSGMKRPVVALTSPSATFVVDSILDLSDTDPDDGVCSDVQNHCTLRAAIEQANASPGADLIAFAPGITAIRPQGALPGIHEPVTIDGGTGDVNRIALDGTASGPVTAAIYLNSGSNGSTIRSLVINGYAFAAIHIITSNNVVENCYLGTDVNGNLPATYGNEAGVRLYGTGAVYNTIGGTGVASRNVISNNTYGVHIQAGARHNNVFGNFIGTDATGTNARGNSFGVYIGYPDPPPFNNSFDNNIGAATSSPGVPPGNVISGNYSSGVVFITVVNKVQGNIIGADAAGTTFVRNANGAAQGQGVYCYGSTISGLLIGGASTGLRNLISGNVSDGVRVSAGIALSYIQGNWIGTDISGSLGLPNGGQGVRMISATNTWVGLASGTPGTPPGNVISGNGGGGVRLDSSSNILLQGNLIGLNAAGTAALANNGDGVLLITGGQNNTIGGSSVGERNVISGNSSNGVEIDGSGPHTVAGNFIGTALNGSTRIPNVANGVRIVGGSLSWQNTVGGAADPWGTPPGNVISGNNQSGISLGSLQAYVQGNIIGADSLGTAAVQNQAGGVTITNGQSNGIVNNLISGNNYSLDSDGVEITGTLSQSNYLIGNKIGTNLGGTAPLSNNGCGVMISGGADATQITSNLISKNLLSGIRVLTSDSVGNRFIGNQISENGRLGIDLFPLGVTANDSDDSDTGANNLQNFPVLTGASYGGQNVISGTLNSVASPSGFWIELFDSAAADPTLYGEGANSVALLTCTNTVGSPCYCASAGTCSFTATIPGAPLHIITATATNLATSETSEFGLSRTMVTQPCPTTSSCGGSQCHVGDCAPPVNTGTTTCMQGSQIINCDPGKTIFTQHCACESCSGCFCASSRDTWSCMAP